MEIEEARRGTSLVVTPSGRLDSGSAPDFEARLGEAIDGGAHDVVIDLSRLDYISSKGLSALLAAGKRMKRAEGRMVLAAASGAVHQVIVISGFDRVFELHETVDAALGG